MASSAVHQLFEFGYKDATRGHQPQSNAIKYLQGYAAGSVAADKVLVARLDRIRQIKASLVWH
ncbi:MAG TPA: hypothetical protein DCY88_25025 [Cyanobacteria bacterium UBA11372]|nr:hypothetical protein [Cyanobacteria bacterium UBA11372]